MCLHLHSERINIVSPAVTVQSVFVMREKRNPTPDICKASGERKKAWWAQELWDGRAVCLPAGSLSGEPAVWSAQGNLEPPVWHRMPNGHGDRGFQSVWENIDAVLC